MVRRGRREGRRRRPLDQPLRPTAARWRPSSVSRPATSGTASISPSRASCKLASARNTSANRICGRATRDSAAVPTGTAPAQGQLEASGRRRLQLHPHLLAAALHLTHARPGDLEVGADPRGREGDRRHRPAAELPAPGDRGRAVQRRRRVTPSPARATTTGRSSLAAAGADTKARSSAPPAPRNAWTGSAATRPTTAGRDQASKGPGSPPLPRSAQLRHQAGGRAGGLAARSRHHLQAKPD